MVEKGFSDDQHLNETIEMERQQEKVCKENIPDNRKQKERRAC